MAWSRTVGCATTRTRCRTIRFRRARASRSLRGTLDLLLLFGVFGNVDDDLLGVRAQRRGALLFGVVGGELLLEHVHALRDLDLLEHARLLLLASRFLKIVALADVRARVHS